MSTDKNKPDERPPVNVAGIDFSAEIRRVAASIERAPTDDQVSALQEVLKASCIVDPKTLTVAVEFGTKIIPVPEYIAKAAEAFARPAPAEPAPATSDWVKVQVGSATVWRHVDDPRLKVHASIDGKHDADLAAEMKDWPNPYSKGSWNRTRQTIMSNKNPALAAQMKAKAK